VAEVPGAWGRIAGDYRESLGVISIGRRPLLFLILSCGGMRVNNSFRAPRRLVSLSIEQMPDRDADDDTIELYS